MAFMNCRDGQTKLQSVVHALTGCDRRRSYYFSIATCYCTPQAVRDFIEAVQAKVNLVEIYLYVDRRTAISIGQAELSDLENAYPELQVFAVRAGRLFHTKGYCLAAYAGDELVHGRLAIGSANMTSAGLTETHGNVESLAVHSDIATISGFLEFFDDEDNLIDLDKLTDFLPDDTTDFQFALLNCGLFSHKWSATLAAYFSVRFRLNEEGRQRAQEGIDPPPGFQTETATIAKPYFDFDLQDWQPSDRNLVRNFGIESFLGHWVPKSVFEDDQENNERFDQFRSALFEQLELTMDSNCQEILQDFDSLIDEGIIDEPETDPAQGFRDRIASLRNDRDQLYRIWSGRHFFEFPYDLSNVVAIQDTFEDMLRTARRRRRRNKTMNAVLEAEMSKSLEPLQDLLVVDR